MYIMLKQGGSAEEIAHILGHTSLTVAKYYILATPALALIRAKALGTNPVWQNMQAHSKLTQLTQHQPDYQTRLADIERRLQQLEAIQAQWQRRAKTQQLVAAESVLSGGVITEGKVRTLAQLFALEYQQLMQEND